MVYVIPEIPILFLGYIRFHCHSDRTYPKRIYSSYFLLAHYNLSNTGDVIFRLRAKMYRLNKPRNTIFNS